MSSETRDRVGAGDNPTEEAPAYRDPDSGERTGQGDLSRQTGNGRGRGSGEDMDDPSTALFSTQDGVELRGRWADVQTAFVDAPRAAVEAADHLVVEIIQLLSASFSQERSQLEDQWVRGQSVSTEDLRVALQRYRTFFDKLLSV